MLDKEKIRLQVEDFNVRLEWLKCGVYRMTRGEKHEFEKLQKELKELKSAVSKANFLDLFTNKGEN